jgi:CubicO group peptidase (beta-lactamase class C family)
MLKPNVEAMTLDTRFDMASLTKPIATATSVMLLIERGSVRLDDPITKFFPEMDNHGKRSITIEHLLRHRAGLVADNPLGDYQDGPDAAWKRIAEIGLVAPPGERFLYSDVGFIILGKLVEKVAGTQLDAFAAANVFQPLGMTQTSFRPEGPESIAPTEPADGVMLRGVVHDPRARQLGGVAGHAGLFSTALDLSKYAGMLLREGKADTGRAVLAPLTVRAMIDPGETPNRQRRGLGWDVATAFSAPRGSFFGPRGFGHTGFTGTSLWVDPDAEMYVILLTSRLHPDGKGQSPTALRGEVATLAAASITAPARPVGQRPAPAAAPAATNSNVRCGIDVLISRDFDILKGKRVGLVTNHTGKARDGRPTIDVLAGAPGVRLAALFSPEHGIRGLVDKEVPDAHDEKTGLTIHSLYGKTRKPTPDSLQGVDVLVYDIQDIGCRFYTYISTLGLVLEAGAEAGVPVAAQAVGPVPPQLAVGCSPRRRVSRETTTRVRKPSGTVTIAGWLNGTRACLAASSAE